MMSLHLKYTSECSIGTAGVREGGGKGRGTVGREGERGVGRGRERWRGRVGREGERGVGREREGKMEGDSR